MGKSPRSIQVQSSPLAAPDKALKVTVSYDAGGMNFFTGNESARGYYLSTRVVEVSGSLEIYGLLSGFRKLLEPAARFSAARLATLAETAASSPYLPGLVDSTLARSGDSLAP